MKRYILIFSSLALMLTPVQLSDACGWSEDGYEPYTVIFDRDFFSPGSPKRFDLFSDVLFNFDAPPKDDHEKNTEEWQGFLKGISKENAYHLAYEANEQELAILTKDLTDKNYPDEIATTLSQVDWQNIIRYLRFVRKCQPYVNEFDDWSGCFEKNDVFNGLFEEGEAIAASASSDFLKVRIGYQLCRLAHYMGQLDRTARYYDQIVAPLKPESIIYYWAMAHYAASLKADHKLADAQLHYAQVYRHCTTKRLSSFRSLYYSDIDSAVAKCTDGADKISLYVLNSLENGSGNLKNMATIYELDPMSPELEILLYKEIYAYEMDQSWRSSTDPENKTVPELLEFTEKVIGEGKMYRPYIWHLSAGYLSFLNKSFAKAHEHYNAIKASTNTNVTLLKQYVTLLEVLLRTAETKNINTTFEESLLRYLTAMGSVQQGSALYEPSSRISQYVYQTLYAGYRNQGELVKAELVAPHFGNIYDASPMSLFDHPDSALVAGLIKFIDRDDLNAFETYLLTKLPYKKNDLMELQGTMLFRLGHLEEAISFFDQSGELSQIAGDPFETTTIDCISCGESNAPYNKKSLAKEILKYQKLATSDPKKAAEYYFQLGNAWYNMTAYGSAWQHLAYSRPHGDLGTTTDPFEIYWKDGAVDTLGLAVAYKDEEPDYSSYNAGPFKRRQSYYYDCTNALNYYKKAFALSRDDEFKAKCLFMAAKCEEHARHVKEPIIGLPIGTHTYYSKLYNDYSNTKFYSEIIGECAYLRNFKEFRDKNR